MTFSEFKTSVLAASFPLGVPENLTLDDYVVSGLIEAQRWIKCFRYRHDDVTPACNSFWHCGNIRSAGRPSPPAPSPECAPPSPSPVGQLSDTAQPSAQ